MDTVSPSSAPTGSAASSPAGRRDLTPTEFASTVTAITAAFGDPTRRDIFLFAHASDDGVTAAETAKHFDLHANVARHHLDKLASGGYLIVEVAKPSGGVGRPSKRYTTSDEQVHLEVDVRQDDILVALLGRALKMLPPDVAEEMAEEVGWSTARPWRRRWSRLPRTAHSRERCTRSPMPSLPTGLRLVLSTPTLTPEPKNSKSSPSIARSATPSSNIP